MRRALIIIATVIVLLGVGVGAYLYFVTKSPSVAVAPTNTVTLPLADTPKGSTPSTTLDNTPTISSPGSPVVVSSRLVQISSGPVVLGAVVTATSTGVGTSSPLVATVNYIERQSGNVFSYQTNTRTLTRINNKTIPGIQSATWLPDASIAFVRYLSGSDLSTINTYALSATSSTGFFLSQNLSGIVAASTSVLTLASGVNGSIASLVHSDGTRPTTVFATPLTSLRASFLGKGQYLAFSKPSATLPGYAFLVNGAGRFSRIAGPLSGLAALASPSGNWVLISYVDSSVMHTALINTASGLATELPVGTIVDKCVWSFDESSVYCGVPLSPPQALYPDDWYQGEVHFSDKIWDIHVSGRYAQMILDFSTVGKGSLDAVGLAIDPFKNTLVFMNKNDESLWAYSL
jgi:hypothetical protein